MHALVILATFALSPFYQEQSDTGRPAIWVDAKEHDFGSINYQETVKHVFRIENKGKKPLLLKKVEADPNCLISQRYQGLQLAPRERLDLEVRFTPKNLSFEQERDIRLITDDPEAPVFTLTLRAFVKIDYAFSNPFLIFRNVRYGDRICETVEIKSYMEGALEFHDIRPSHPFLSTVFRMEEKGERATYYLDIELDGSKLPDDATRIVGKIEFETNSDVKPSDQLPVMVTIAADLVPFPRILSARDLEFEKEYTTEVQLKKHASQDFEIEDVRFSHDFIDIEGWNRRGEHIEIVYALADDLQYDSIYGRFELHLSQNDTKLILIPFSATLSEQAVAQRGLRSRRVEAPVQKAPEAEQLPVLDDSSPRPSFAVDKLEHNYGTVRMGEQPEATFMISNEGDADLTIKALRTCGCILDEMDQKVIPPGRSEPLKVKILTEGKPATFAKSLNLVTNDPLNEKVRLNLKAHIHADYRLSRSLVRFDDIREGMVVSERFEVDSFMDQALDIREFNFEPDFDFVHCAFIPSDKVQIYFIELTVDTRGQKLEPGSISGQVNFKSNSPQLPEGHFGFRGDFIQDIKVEPKRASLYRLANSSSKDRETVRLINVLDKSFSIKEVSLDLDCVDVEVSDTGGTTSTILLKLNEKATEPSYKANMIVRLDYHNPEVMEVPVNVFIKKPKDPAPASAPPPKE